VPALVPLSGGSIEKMSPKCDVDRPVVGKRSAVSAYRYTYRVTWSPEDGEHVGLCVEFPSLSWLARSPEAALEGIRHVVASAIADMECSGE
jgi:hypothetical protein